MGCGSSVQGKDRYVADALPADEKCGNQAVPASKTQAWAATGDTTATQGKRDIANHVSQQQHIVAVCGAAGGQTTPAGAPLIAAGLPQEVPRVSLESLEQVEVLDETPMSLVVHFCEKQTGRHLAGKRTKKGSAVHSQGGQLQEVKMLKKLSRKSVSAVVTLQGVCETADAFWIFMELCPGGRLEEWLNRAPASPAVQLAARQLLEAVQTLHAWLICHLDIKPDNVLLSDRGHVKLCDFVCAVELEAPEQELVGMCGTDGYRAPEVSRDVGYRAIFADIFSLGRTLQSIAKVEPAWRALTKQCREMTSEDPSKRPSLAAVHKALFCESAAGELRGSAAGPGAADDYSNLHTVHCSAISLPREGSQKQHQQQQQQQDDKSSASYQSGAVAMLHKPPDLQTRAPKRPAAGVQQKQAAVQVKADFAALPCGSILCSRLGTCLCHDRPSELVSSMRPSERVGATNTPSLRRSRTPP
mmetsp:Transcript_63836/g.152251  ORF Transcript_63836/g.152251 Transcript_63836/m.152251 type:complete len:472 (-) Transcript_63836:75-1490(-)